MNRRITLSLSSIVLVGILALSLSILVPLVLRATSAHADSNAIVNATAGVTVPGAPTAVTGSGFSPGETVFITFGNRTANANADGTGSFGGISLPIPNVPTGLQFVSAFGVTSGRWGLAYVYVAGFNPTASPNSYYVLPGAPLSFSGSGFAPNEVVTAKYNGTTLATFTTNASGAFSGPASTSLPVSLSNTTATITFTGATSKATTSFDITIGQLYPSITPSTWYTGAGSIISLTGSGFAPNEGISVTIGTQHASTTTDSTGAFTLGSIQLPKVGGAALSIVATGAKSLASVSVSIFVTGVSPWITFSTYWAQGGSPLIINGNSFAGGEQVGMYSASGAIGTTTADQSGNFAFSTTVPFAPSGSLTITAVGADSTAQASGAIFVAPVFTDLQLASYAGAPGTAITFIGHGYLPNEPVQVTTDRTGTTVVATFTTDATGSFGGTYAVPSTFTQGNLVLTVEGMHSFDQKTITYFVTGS